jgi:hypothetical protein
MPSCPLGGVVLKCNGKLAYVLKHDCNSGSVRGDQREVGEKKKAIMNNILKYIASVYENSIKCTESC